MALAIIQTARHCLVLSWMHGDIAFHCPASLHVRFHLEAASHCLIVLCDNHASLHLCFDFHKLSSPIQVALAIIQLLTMSVTRLPPAFTPVLIFMNSLLLFRTVA